MRTTMTISAIHGLLEALLGPHIAVNLLIQLLLDLIRHLVKSRLLSITTTLA